ncbi:ImmA/IrrE family metallo-endopeptidase [Thermosulfurimonas dismutans]|uniref:IrrE N-terminal-like domain-containing protein n=1 Tax=Thermosulfurimonas dismutans TaxID=999894 RepID=A0A179D4D8_9BACT|nr:ImmA/IrrE family metallo-endopeptidase [Thermosulfurimonas dismutans]OAQ20342.1 hypothetical protein TDIS_1537 [Thermosulfurimonas dismutans]
MNPKVLYSTMKRQYLANPTLANAMALMGALAHKYPLLQKAPLSPMEIERLAQEAGIEIWPYPLEQTTVLTVMVRDPQDLPREIAGRDKPLITEREPGLLSDEMLSRVKKLLERGGGPVVIMREKLPEEEYAPTLAHELGHIFLGHLENWSVPRGVAEFHAHLFARWVSGVPHPRLDSKTNLVLEALTTGEEKLLKEALVVLKGQDPQEVHP